MSNAAKLYQDQKHLIPVGSPVPNRRILVVDDEPEIAAGIERLLAPKSTGKIVEIKSSRRVKKTDDDSPRGEFEVVVCHDPHQAIKEIEKSLQEKKPFAMGFFDVMLGAEIDGIELAKRVLDIDEHLYAVFVTAYHDRSVDTIGNFLGNDKRERWDYINKPFNEGEILQKARNITSLWDLQRLKAWQAERLSEAHQLLLVQERNSSVAAIGRSIAHEFGNLLTHIIGHAQLAQMTADPEEMKKSLEIIYKAGCTAGSVLTNFRKLNESDEAMVEFSVVDLQTVAEEAIELMEFRFRRHSIPINKKEMESVEAEVNSSAIIQILANLFINAIHAMQDGGELFLYLKKEGDFAVLKVRDSGEGIPEASIEKVAEPLFTTKGKNGSGLGLAICKEIIEIEHGGEFLIRNHPDGGAEFTVKIPLACEVNKTDSEVNSES